MEEKKWQIDLGPLVLSVPELPKNLDRNLLFLNPRTSPPSFSLLKFILCFQLQKPTPSPPSSSKIINVVSWSRFVSLSVNYCYKTPFWWHTAIDVGCFTSSGVSLAALLISTGFAHKSGGHLTISQWRVASSGTTVETGALFPQQTSMGTFSE